jgi:hypothetical protein
MLERYERCVLKHAAASTVTNGEVSTVTNGAVSTVTNGAVITVINGTVGTVTNGAVSTVTNGEVSTVINGAVSMVTSLHARRPSARMTVGTKDFSLLHNVQTGPRPQAASHSTDTGRSYQGGKVAGV